MEIKMGENRGRRLFRKRRDSSTVLSILHLSAREVASNHPFLFHPLSRYFFLIRRIFSSMIYVYFCFRETR